MILELEQPLINNACRTEYIAIISGTKNYEVRHHPGSEAQEGRAIKELKIFEETEHSSIGLSLSKQIQEKTYSILAASSNRNHDEYNKYPSQIKLLAREEGHPSDTKYMEHLTKKTAHQSNHMDHSSSTISMENPYNTKHPPSSKETNQPSSHMKNPSLLQHREQPTQTIHLKTLTPSSTISQAKHTFINKNTKTPSAIHIEHPSTAKYNHLSQRKVTEHLSADKYMDDLIPNKHTEHTSSTEQKEGVPTIVHMGHPSTAKYKHASNRKVTEHLSPGMYMDHLLPNKHREHTSSTVKKKDVLPSVHMEHPSTVKYKHPFQSKVTGIYMDHLKTNKRTENPSTTAHEEHQSEPVNTEHTTPAMNMEHESPDQYTKYETNVECTENVFHEEHSSFDTPVTYLDYVVPTKHSVVAPAPYKALDDDAYISTPATEPQTDTHDLETILNIFSRKNLRPPNDSHGKR